MDLKEFDLDLPYIIDEEKINAIMQEKGCLRDEATKLDYELNWKDDRRKFRLETRCISAMFERVFGKFETEECWKILVECVDIVKDDRVLNFSGVYTVQVQVDYKNFFLSDSHQKKQKTLEILMEGCKTIARNKGWDTQLFEFACEKVIKADYKNEWIWKKAVKSPDGKYIAEVLMQHDVNAMNISILSRDKNGIEVYKKQIISVLPDEFVYTKYLGELKWLSNDEVALFNKKQDEKNVIVLPKINW